MTKLESYLFFDGICADAREDILQACLDFDAGISPDPWLEAFAMVADHLGVPWMISSGKAENA